MFRGFFALFTSGLIFNPMVLIGVIVGLSALIKLPPEQIKALFLNYQLYLLVLLLSAAYRFGFKKTYKRGGVELDYTMMILATLGGVLQFAAAAVLSMAFVTILFF